MLSPLSIQFHNIYWETILWDHGLAREERKDFFFGYSIGASLCPSCRTMVSSAACVVFKYSYISIVTSDLSFGKREPTIVACNLIHPGPVIQADLGNYLGIRWNNGTQRFFQFSLACVKKGLEICNGGRISHVHEQPFYTAGAIVFALKSFGESSEELRKRRCSNMTSDDFFVFEAQDRRLNLAAQHSFRFSKVIKIVGAAAAVGDSKSRTFTASGPTYSLSIVEGFRRDIAKKDGIEIAQVHAQLKGRRATQDMEFALLEVLLKLSCLLMVKLRCMFFYS